jgi:hypothetical protein
VTADELDRLSSFAGRASHLRRQIACKNTFLSSWGKFATFLDAPHAG